MSISNLTVPNNFDLFCNSLTANTVLSNRPTSTEISGLCISTTTAGANTTGGTAAHKVVTGSIQIFFSVVNGICYLWKEGTSSSFPQTGDNNTLKSNLGGTNTLYLLARSSTPTASDGGGIFIPAGTLPLCQSQLGQKPYYGYCNMNIPLKQNTFTPVGEVSVPVMLDVITNNANGQYIEITIPRSYDYIPNGNAGITASVNTLDTVQDPNKPLNDDSQDIRYIRQNFSGNETSGFQNAFPPFFVQYPVEQS